MMRKVEIDNTTVDLAAFTRRDFLRTGTLSGAGLLLAGKLGAFPSLLPGWSATARPRASWQVPKAAYMRTWGLAGPGPCSPIADSECATGKPTGLQNYAGGMSVPGLGIPLGGVGAGSFHYNLFGTFGPWNMGGGQSSNYWEMRTLACFGWAMPRTATSSKPRAR